MPCPETIPEDERNDEPCHSKGSGKGNDDDGDGGDHEARSKSDARYVPKCSPFADRSADWALSRENHDITPLLESKQAAKTIRTWVYSWDH